MKKIMMIALILTGAATASAKPKEKTYPNADPDKLFVLLEKAVHSKFVITFADKDAMLVSFKTGTSLRSKGMDVNASVEKLDVGGAKIVVNAQKAHGQALAWGAGDSIADDVFKLVDEELKK